MNTLSERPKTPEADAEIITYQSLTINKKIMSSIPPPSKPTRADFQSAGATTTESNSSTAPPINGTPVDIAPVPAQDLKGAMTHMQSAGNLYDFCYNKFVLKMNFSWASVSTPGTILALLPVTPLESNEVVAHLARLFNGWVGSLDYQLCVMGTGFQAGRLLISWIPPNVNPRKLNLSQLTTYPGTTIDVKCENPVYITSKDQNPRAFHYTREAKDIGGNLVISVLSQLRNSSEGTSTANVTLSEKLGA